MSERRMGQLPFSSCWPGLSTCGNEHILGLSKCLLSLVRVKPVGCRVCATTRWPAAAHLIKISISPCHLLSVRPSSEMHHNYTCGPSIMIGSYGGVGVAEGI